MKKEVIFELGSSDFFKSNDMFVKEFKVVKLNSSGCLSNDGFVYFLDVLISNGWNGNVKNTSFLYSCVLEISCDNQSNCETFSRYFKHSYFKLVLPNFYNHPTKYYFNDNN